MFVSLLLCLSAVPGLAQRIEWTRQFGTTGHDEGYAVAAAPGALYVAGTVNNGAFPGGSHSGREDAFVSKFDLSGTLLWSRQFGGAGVDKALGVAADATGVYVTGELAGEAIVRKFGPDGTELWTKQFGGPRDDSATSAAADNTGLYVVGTVDNTALPGQANAGGTDGFLRKYDFGGNELWTRQFGTNNAERCYGVAVDASGVYVTGETNGALGTAVGGTDYFVRKYDGSGTLAWTRQFGTTTTDGAGYGGGIAVNSTGVYVTGVTSGTFAGQTKLGGLFDAFVQKFDLNGNPQWVRQFGTSDGDDYGYGVAVHGRWVYASGQAGSGLFLWRFDADGNDTGNIQRGTFATRSYGVVTESSGAYLTGGANANQIGQPPIGDQDAFLIKVPHPPEITGISDAFTGQTGVAPTTWIAIYGSNLSSTTRTWDGAISGTQLPASLDGVGVSINGRAATLYFVSPSQVNVLGPLDDTTGNVQVTLTNANGSSPSFSVRKADVLPAFYAPFGLSGTLRVTGVALDGTLVGAVGADPRVPRGVRPGEVVQFFATGFGRTNPTAPSDLLFAGAPEVVTRPRITIGGREATIFGNGNLVSPGLYQFNVTIPDLADGDHAMIAEIGSVRSLATVVLSVRR